MDIQQFKIQSLDNVVDYLVYLQQNLNIPFHPQLPFSEYLEATTLQPVFSEDEAWLLERNLQECLKWCEANQQSILQIGALRYNYILGNLPLFDLDAIDLHWPLGNAYILMGLWTEAACEADWSDDERALVLKQATSKDYTHLLATLRLNSKAK